QPEHAVEEVARKLTAALEEALALVDRERGEPRRACRWVRRIGVAVEELRHSLRRSLDDGAVDAVAYRDGAHRLSTVGEGLRHGDEIGNDLKGGCGEGFTRAAEAADHLIED